MSIDRSNINQAIDDRIAADPAFRAQLQADPHAALAALTGMTIPESVRITVHEESPADIHLVIAADSALNDSDLELVSGGVNWYPNNTGGCGY
jgi:hypothetical protein